MRRWLRRRRLTAGLAAALVAWYLGQLAVVAAFGRATAIQWFYVTPDPSPGLLFAPLSHDVDELYDVVPEGWEVVGGNVFVGDAGDGQQVVYYDADGDGDQNGIAASDVGDGDTVTMTYFVEAPPGAGEYAFGPAKVVTSETEDGDSGFGDPATVTVSGTTSTEYVVGADQRQVPR